MCPAIEFIVSRMLGNHGEQLTRLHLIGNFVNPVAMRESQEYFRNESYVTSQNAYRLRPAYIEPAERKNQSVGQHQQRCLVKMGIQKKQKVLVTKLAKHAASGVRRKRLVRMSEHFETVVIGNETGITEIVLTSLISVPIIATAPLEICQEAFRTG